MSDKETNVDHLENGSEEVLLTTRGEKIKRHLKKWWWAYLLAFIAVVVLVVCLIIFVAVPKIAQQHIDQAKLTIQGIHITQPQSTNFTLSINSTIEADASVHAVIDAFEGEMYLEDWAPQTPFVRLSFPRLTTESSLMAVNITQFTEILDIDALTVFNMWFLANETLNVSVRGNSYVQVSGISTKFPVSFQKTVNMTGMAGFAGMAVPQSEVFLTADAQGDNFFGNATIPNPTLFTLEIGNASFINYLQDQNVGTVFIDNLVLQPGINTVPIRANISTTPVLNTIQEQPYCQTGLLPFELQGLNVTNHGQYISYYALALAASNSSVDIDVGSDLKALGLNITCPTSSKKRGYTSDLLW